MAATPGQPGSASSRNGFRSCAPLCRGPWQPGPRSVEPTLAIDAYVELTDLTLDLVAQISRLAPFGPGNPPLVLAVRDLRVLSDATIGRTGEHRRITVEDARRPNADGILVAERRLAVAPGPF